MRLVMDLTAFREFLPEANLCSEHLLTLTSWHDRLSAPAVEPSEVAQRWARSFKRANFAQFSQFSTSRHGGFVFGPGWNHSESRFVLLSQSFLLAFLVLALHSLNGNASRHSRHEASTAGIPFSSWAERNFTERCVIYAYRLHTLSGAEGITWLLGGRVARRKESFCKGLAFSNRWEMQYWLSMFSFFINAFRPVSVNENVCIRLTEVSTSWSGVLRFGVTNVDPETYRNIQVPKWVRKFFFSSLFLCFIR